MAGEMSSWQINNEEEEMVECGGNDAEMSYEDYLTMVDNEDDKDDYNDLGDINYKNYLLNGGVYIFSLVLPLSSLRGETE